MKTLQFIGRIQQRGFATSAATVKKTPIVKTTKLTNIGTLVGFNNSDELIKQHDVELTIQRGQIVEFGKKVEASGEGVTVLDVKGALVTPGFVDPHTHIFPPKDRANEFAMRVTQSYQEIAENGGGILSSVKACREATADELYEVNARNVRRFIALGTTTLEMKSGYGLDLETEIKLLKVINDLKINFKKQIEIIPTFLGAHAFPPEFKDKKDEYVELIINEMIPAVKEDKLAEFCDVFCENGYFDAEQSKRILKAAKANRLKVRMHADEFEDSRAAELAAKLKAFSADHLMAVSDKGIEKLAKANVHATILPGTTVFLGKQGFAPARKLIDGGVKVAIASDFNPGSSTFNCQPLMMNLAMQNCKMTLEEAFKGVTKNAATSLNRKKVGIIDQGAQADLLVWDLQNLEQIPYYHYESTERITHFIKKGKVFDRKKALKA